MIEAMEKRSTAMEFLEKVIQFLTNHIKLFSSFKFEYLKLTFLGEQHKGMVAVFV